eukprot:1161034-Pelagomonas_calceolata.AAC.2
MLGREDAASGKGTFHLNCVPQAPHCGLFPVPFESLICYSGSQAAPPHEASAMELLEASS